MTIQTTQDTLSDVCTTEALVKENPNLFTKSQLDWLLKTRHRNGLFESGAILKISRKLYLNKPVFINWFMNQKAA